MDGNGRWAQRRLLPRNVGHVKGASKLKSIVELCYAQGIHCLTVFAFSTENWKRPPDEVAKLFDLFAQYLQREIDNLHKEGCKLRIIGDRSAFPIELQNAIETAEDLTATNNRLTLCVAVNYGGRWDILQAVQAWQEANPYATVAELTSKQLEPYLSTAGLPEPDLLIRTGGEARLSNFLIWQTAYTELYFCDQFWPDFNASSLEKALENYDKRVRRFGKTDEQVQGLTTA